MTAPVRPGAKKFSIATGKVKTGMRVLLYGTGGIGKSSLLRNLSGSVIVDVEGGTSTFNATRLSGIDKASPYTDVVEALRDHSLWKDTKAIGIDTITDLQDKIVTHVLKTVPKEGGGYPATIEGYGYGKGYRLVYDEFMRLVGELDRHADAGRHVVLLAHDARVDVPNPSGDNYLQFQPQLLNTGQTGRVRDRMKGWCDHMPFVGYDIAVNNEGKGQGKGTRTIYLQERPAFWAKSRGDKPLPNSIPFDSPESSDLWKLLLGDQ